jgi:hypothetical protein
MRLPSLANICAASVAAALVLLPVGSAGATTPQLPHCTYSVKKSQSFASVKKHGVPVSVTCDAEADVSSLLQLNGKPADDWDERYRLVQDPPTSRHVTTHVVPGQAATTRVYLTKNAAKFLGHYKRPKLTVLLGVQPEGKKYFQSIDNGKRIVLV